MRNKFVGEVFKTEKYGNVLVLEYRNCSEVYIKFLNTGYETVTQMVHIRKGTVKDRLAPSVFGVGVTGDLPIVDRNGVVIREFRMWAGMLERCYSDNLQEKRLTYIGCTASENFKYFPYFKEWCQKQVGFYQDGWHLDKDILVKGNKVYSEDTCCFVPPEINVLLTSNKVNRGCLPVGVTCRGKILRFRATVGIGGKNISLGTYNTPEEAFRVYKVSKEKHIKEVAEKWKDQIDIRVYEALMNYEVEIDD